MMIINNIQEKLNNKVIFMDTNMRLDQYIHLIIF